MFKSYSNLFLAATFLLGTAPGLLAQGGKSAIKNQQRSKSTQSGKSSIKSRSIDYSGKSTARYSQQTSPTIEATPQERQVVSSDAFSVKPWKPAVQAFPIDDGPEASVEATPQEAAVYVSPVVHSASISPVAPVEAEVKTPATPASTYTPMRVSPPASPIEEASKVTKRNAEITRARELEKLKVALAQGETFAVPTPESPSEVNGAVATADQVLDQTSSETTGSSLDGAHGHLVAIALPPKQDGRNVGGTVDLEDEEANEQTGDPTIDGGATGTSDSPAMQVSSTMAYCIGGVEAGEDPAVDEMEDVMRDLQKLENRKDWTLPGAYQALQSKLTQARGLYTTINLRYNDDGYLSLINHYQGILDSLDPVTGKFKSELNADRQSNFR